MILKLVELAVLASLAVRFLTGHWPWNLSPTLAWDALFSGGRETRARLRRAQVLLGLPAQAGRDDILDAHRKLIARVHPDRGGSSEAVHEANAARDLLLDALGPNNRS